MPMLALLETSRGRGCALFSLMLAVRHNRRRRPPCVGTPFFSVQLQNISEQKKATDETWQNMQGQVRFASDS